MYLNYYRSFSIWGQFHLLLFLCVEVGPQHVLEGESVAWFAVSKPVPAVYICFDGDTSTGGTLECLQSLYSTLLFNIYLNFHF